MRRRALATVDANCYCLLTTGGKSKEIKADTAYEAVKASGLSHIIKIERMFNSGRNILDKSHFLSEAPSPQALQSGMTELSVHDRISRRRNPIISADELDVLMQGLRSHAVQEIQTSIPGASSEETTISSNPGEGFDPSSQDIAPPYVEPPLFPAPDVKVTNPVGMDVHNDGFDEIIPSTPIKSFAPKAQEVKEPVRAADSDMPSQPGLSPERELSPEEVEQLLGGKE